jgi:acetyl-CoA acetyltransferase family protein
MLSAIIFPYVQHPTKQIRRVVRSLPEDQRQEIFNTYIGDRKSKRDRPGRGLEYGYPIQFDIIAGFAEYRDLQRHRMLTQQRQDMGVLLGYTIPEEIQEIGKGEVVQECFERSEALYNELNRAGFRQEAQYASLFNHLIRWNMGMNLRELGHFTELRTQKAGHPKYRRICQTVSKLYLKRHPEMAPVLKFVDHNDYDQGITRAEQDRYAEMSHHRAARATEQGWLEQQIVTARPPPKFEPLDADNGIRGDTSLEKLAKLRPAFDRKFGTITAGNSSYFTDGASAVLLMSEQKARELEMQPLASVVSWCLTAMDPLEELLLGPALAIPKVLQRAGLTLGDIDIIELHEAFAGQVLAVLKLLEQDAFARERLGRDTPVGAIDLDKMNLWGGSLSIGHPFGATGGRLVTTCCRRLEKENGRYGLIAACASGALGYGIVLERMAS